MLYRKLRHQTYTIFIPVGNIFFSVQVLEVEIVRIIFRVYIYISLIYQLNCRAIMIEHFMLKHIYKCIAIKIKIPVLKQHTAFGFVI